jgi:putative ABC transport system permease protein
MVLADVTQLAAAGVAVGLPLAFVLSRLVREQLFEVSSYDPLTLCCVCGQIVFVAMIAAALPAMRAAKVDPMVALRYE